MTTVSSGARVSSRMPAYWFSGIVVLSCACSSSSSYNTSDGDPLPQGGTSSTSTATSRATTTSNASVGGSSSVTTSGGSLGGASSVSTTGLGGATSITSTVTTTTTEGSGGTLGVGGSTAGQGGTTAQGGSSAAGGAGSTTDGGSALQVQPSAGCNGGNASPSLNIANTIISVPPTHDGSTPVPVVMAFHAAGNPNTQLQDRYADDLEDKYLVLYPKSAGSGWNDGTDGPIVDTMFSQITANACIDENRVFATGHSSGAQFIVQRLCAGETRWRAVSPVASSEYCSSWDPVPALVIHGIGDQERSWDPNGEEDIVPYRTSNGCQATSTPYPVDGCSSGGVDVDPGCVEFDGCSEQTLWCQHNDPQYGTSHHGIPCFADSLIREFFDSF